MLVLGVSQILDYCVLFVKRSMSQCRFWIWRSLFNVLIHFLCFSEVKCILFMSSTQYFAFRLGNGLNSRQPSFSSSCVNELTANVNPEGMPFY